MQANTTHQGTTGAAHRLGEEHTIFDQRFDDLCRRARAGDWHDLDEVWDVFAADLEEHLAFEEAEVFPAYARLGPDARSLVEELSAQHVEIRRLLESIGLEIQLKEVRASSIDAFTDLMRKHAAIENARIYPWVAREGRLWPPRRAAREGS